MYPTLAAAPRLTLVPQVATWLGMEAADSLLHEPISTGDSAIPAPTPLQPCHQTEAEYLHS